MNLETGALAGDRGKLDEFDLIASVFAPLTDGDERALGLLDDAAVLSQVAGRDTVITTDTMVEGIHFLDAEPPDVLARRLLRVNLSDLASMGAEPDAYFLNLTLPARTNKEWLSSFAEGLRVDQSAFGVRLLGGDTTHTKRSLTVTATLLGEVPTHGAITRGGARAGDDIYVSGTIGDASLGLKMLISGADNQDALVKRFQLPEPRVSLGAKLRGLATAMADVSDGLAADLVHICRASRVSATVETDSIPLSVDVQTSLASGNTDMGEILSGGDDYELVFTASPDTAGRVAAASQSAEVPITHIGRISSGASEVIVLGPDGREIKLETTGYRHF